MRTRAEFVEFASPLVHEAISAWGVANGQPAYPEWEHAEAWMKDATRASVTFVLDNPDAPVSSHHDQWVEKKIADGWTFGETKDPENKRHPLLIDFADLPEVEQRKDELLRSLVLQLWRQENDSA
jgi:hypothetical protein